MVIELTSKKKKFSIPLTLSLGGEGIVRCLLLPPLPEWERIEVRGIRKLLSTLACESAPTRILELTKPKFLIKLTDILLIFRGLIHISFSTT